MHPPGDTGGTLIENYQLEIKLEGQEDWEVILGQDGQFNLDLEHVLEGDIISAGDQVQARYRVKNQIGWSEFSTHAYLLKAGVPRQPPVPIFVSANSNSVTIDV